MLSEIRKQGDHLQNFAKCYRDFSEDEPFIIESVNSFVPFAATLQSLLLLLLLRVLRRCRSARASAGRLS